MADEYIRKADAVDRMNRYGSIWMEYTEGMSKHEVAEQALKASKQAVIDVLENLPSADVVQVVRCKDCRKCSYDPLFNYFWCNLTLGTRRVKPDDFCSYGERKE